MCNFKQHKLSAAITAISSSLILAGVTLPSSPAQAQQLLEEIVVTARMRDESFIDVPITSNVFTRTDIETLGIETPRDFIALTPNVTLVQTQNAGNSFVTARGISQNRNTEMSVAVMVDGVLMSNPAQFNQELFDIEQIEVLKGPQGAIYGRNAIGGAITITTRETSDELEGRVLVGGESGPGWRLQGSLSGPVGESDTLKFRASVSMKDSDGHIKNTYLNEEADPYRDISGRLRFMWDPNDAFRADLRLYRSDLKTQALYYNIRSPLPEPFPGAPISLGHGDGDPNSVNDTSLDVRVNNPGVNNRDLTNVSLKLDWFMDYGTFSSVTSRDSTEELLTGDAFDFVPIDESIGVAFGFTDQNQSQYYDITSFSQEFRFTSPTENRLRWIAGAYAIWTDRFVSTGNMVDTGGGVFPVFYQPRGDFPYDFATDPVNPQVTFLADEQDNFAWAAFGEVAYDTTEQLELALSLRYDRDRRKNITRTPTAFLPNVPGFPQGFTGEERTQTWDDWQPKLTARWKAHDNLSYFASLSRGFRSGGFNQTGVGPVAADNGFAGVGDTFDAETVNTGEIGMKGVFMEGRLQANAAVYHTVAKGTYFFIFLAANSTQNLGNLDEVEYTGFELDMAARINDNLDLNIAYGYTDSEITKSQNPADIGNRAPNVSRYTFNLGPRYHQPLPFGNGVEAFVRAEYQILGKTSFFDLEQPGNNERDNVELLDLRLGMEVPDEWSVTLWARNALNEKYNAEYSTGGFVFKAQPRVWGLDFIRHF